MNLPQKKESEITEEDYLSGEIVSEIKHELIDGYVYAMAGASNNHNLISRNCSFSLENKLREKQSPCKTFIADMKVKTANNFYYPDIMVSCNDDDKNEYYINSPKIIFEVLSTSTQKNDKTKKMLAYFNIPSLEEYVLVDQYSCEIQVFRRQESWKSTYYFLGDEIRFDSLDLTLSVEDVYYQIENDAMKEFVESKLEA